MKNLLIYGAGSVGKFVAEIIKDLSDTLYPEWKLIGFLDDDATLKGSEFCGVPIHGDFEWLRGQEQMHVVFAFASEHFKQEIFDNIQAVNPEVKFPCLVHPKAWVAENVKMGIGNIVGPGAAVEPDVSMGSFNFIHKNASLGSECVLGDHVILSTGVTIGSFNNIGSNSFWGIGSSSNHSVSVGENCNIAPGSFLLKDFPANSSLAGNPAISVKEETEVIDGDKIKVIS